MNRRERSRRGQGSVTGYTKHVCEGTKSTVNFLVPWESEFFVPQEVPSPTLKHPHTRIHPPTPPPSAVCNISHHCIHSPPRSFNQLDLPEYPTFEVLKDMLTKAVPREGPSGFRTFAVGRGRARRTGVGVIADRGDWTGQIQL